MPKSTGSSQGSPNSKRRKKHVDEAYADELDQCDWQLRTLDADRGEERLDKLYAASTDPVLLVPAIREVLGIRRRQIEATGRTKHDVLEPLPFLGPLGLDKHEVIWPKLVPYYQELCTGNYVEAVMTGGIGTAKTFLAVYALLYEVHKLCCLANPHAEYGLDPASDIVMVFQSVTQGTAKSVDYDLFRNAIDGSPWFQANSNYQHDLKSMVNFDFGLVIKPVNSLETAAIGQNVIGGLIDEINFLAMVQASKRAIAGEDVYDQAQANYNAISRRRESRFMERGGHLPGLLALVSSTRYPGQFTDRKIERARKEIAEKGKSTIFIYEKRTWEVKPDEDFEGTKFKVYIGDRNTNPFIIPDDEADQWEDDPLVDLIPTEYRHSFEDDIHAALRDIAGKSTQTQHAYFSNMPALDAAFGHHENIFNVGRTDFERPELTIRPKLIQNPGKLHFAHVDLGAVSDSAGICIGHVAEFIKVKRTDGAIETLPKIVIDGLVEIHPPRAGEINFEKIRTIFYRCRELGMNLKWISYDSWQSRDSLQILKNLDFIVGTQSIDKGTHPYDLTKHAINEGRLLAPTHEKTETELRGLQWHREKDKIDHMPQGSKDCSDALAGVVFGLTLRRELWVTAGIEPPKVILDQQPKEDEAI